MATTRNNLDDARIDYWVGAIALITSGALTFYCLRQGWEGEAGICFVSFLFSLWLLLQANLSTHGGLLDEARKRLGG